MHRQQNIPERVGHHATENDSKADRKESALWVRSGSNAMSE
jgi:hypothetical protein